VLFILLLFSNVLYQPEFVFENYLGILGGRPKKRVKKLKRLKSLRFNGTLCSHFTGTCCPYNFKICLQRMYRHERTSGLCLLSVARIIYR